MTLLATRITALLLLLCYGTVSSPLGALVFLSLADQDSSHELRLVTDGHAVQVVLHHGAAGYTPRVKDHSGSVTRLLACLCSANEHGDHVFREESGASLKEDKSLTRTVRAADELPATLLPFTGSWCATSSHGANSAAKRLAQSSPPKLKRPMAGMGATALLV